MRGRAAIFADTGLGKPRMQTEWAMNVHSLTGGEVLILAPLAVAAQTVREAAGLGYEITMCRSQDDLRPGLNIANYEMLHKFETIFFDGIVLDESSILNSFTGNSIFIQLFTSLYTYSKATVENIKHNCSANPFAGPSAVSESMPTDIT